MPDSDGEAPPGAMLPEPLGEKPVEKAPAAAQEPPAEDPRAAVARLRAEAARIEASLPAPDLPPDIVRLRVEKPHSEFSYGGAWVGSDWTEVHKLLAPMIMQSAAEAGVTLSQEG